MFLRYANAYRKYHLQCGGLIILLSLKVETIGDCYGKRKTRSFNTPTFDSLWTHISFPLLAVAVAGLPTPCHNHAIVMARFARECLDAMKAVTMDLESTLGEGTRDLDLRVGLNSGATTAGLLRGEKSRFQLFGDTVR